MVLEDTIKSAKSGNTNSMIELGYHYYNNKNFQEAAYWWEEAAKLDIPNAMYLIANLKSMSAIAGLDFDLGNSFKLRPDDPACDYSLNEWKSVYYWAKKAYECSVNKIPGCESYGGESALNTFENVSYYVGLIYYFKQDYSTALNYIKPNGPTEYSLLYGLCVAKSARTDNDLAKSFQYFNKIYKNIEYAKKAKKPYEEMIYIFSCGYLANLYRLGVGTSINLEKSVEVLKLAKNNIRESYKDIINEELRHYKEKLFGGYKYV